MHFSALQVTLALACLVLTATVATAGRSHMVFDSALEAPHGIAAGEQMPEMYSLPEIQWMLSGSKREAVDTDVPAEENAQVGMELVRRDDGKDRKPGCKNYFWKSRTAC
ncbi:somatostatin 2 [Chanos chanos]|uniref:Somatostatin 2 n=1 Tax=Chanos chanos TaxID=29144 RepID=A0A6J2VDQ3_CHACN|nr:somatostatin-2-like [Chanos chanos]